VVTQASPTPSLDDMKNNPGPARALAGWIATVVLGVSICVSASAEGTLDKVRQSGEITVGHQDAAFPFSYYDDHQQIVGYTMDVCRQVVDAIRNALNLKTLAIKRNPALAVNRASLLSQGTIDLDCGPALITGEQGARTAFSLPYFVANVRFLSRKSANLRRMGDLKGKPVISTSGSPELKQLLALNRSRRLDLSVAAAKTTHQAFQAVASGSAAAFFMDDVTLHAFVAESGAAAEWAVSEETFAAKSYGLMLRRDDPKLGEIVDGALRGLYKSGELGRIHDKWFLGPVRRSQGSAVTLGLPMDDALKRALSAAAGSGAQK
jgi:glutamate/aspartate transport system substrate-binding protein